MTEGNRLQLFGADRVLEETVTRHTFRRALRARSIGRAGQLAVETNATRKVSFACNEQASLRSKLSFFFLFTSLTFTFKRERLCFLRSPTLVPALSAGSETRISGLPIQGLFVARAQLGFA